MIARSIEHFASSYTHLRTKNFGHNKTTKLITEGLPEEIYNKLSLERNEYLIRGSVGQGNWADIPWIAIMHKGVTESTRNGYYVVLVFERDMSKIYISLGLGWMQFADRYGNKNGKVKVREYAEKLYGFLPGDGDSISKKIDLGAKSGLGKGYEVSNVVSTSLDIQGLRDNEVLDELKKYLGYYKNVMNEYGADIFYDNLPETEEDNPDVSSFKSLVKRSSLSINKGKSLFDLKLLVDTQPPSKKKTYVSQIIRNASFAEYVKARAKYVCEICGRKPFTKKNGQPYAEADHVEPLGKLGVDHPDNMRCLCPQCHRVITYGSDSEITKLLTKGY